MPLPLILGAASLVSLAPTAMNIASKVGKFYGRYGGTPLGQAAQFGLGYGASTAVGYNLIPQFGRKSYNNSKSSTYDLYGYRPRSYGRRTYGRRYYYSRYPRRYRTYSRRTYRRGYY